MSVPLSTKPMEAEPVDDLPRGKGWLYDAMTITKRRAVGPP